MVRQVLRFTACIRDECGPVLLILLAAAWMAPDSAADPVAPGTFQHRREAEPVGNARLYESLLDAGENLDRDQPPDPRPHAGRGYTASPCRLGGVPATRDCLKPRPGTCSGGSCPTSMCAGTERPLRSNSLGYPNCKMSPSTKNVPDPGLRLIEHEKHGVDGARQLYPRACWNDGSTSKDGFRDS